MVLGLAAKQWRIWDAAGARSGRLSIRLPSLFGFQHTLRKLSAAAHARAVNTDVSTIHAWLRQIETALSGKDSLSCLALQLIVRRQPDWTNDLKRAAANVSKAAEMLQRLKAALPSVLQREAQRIADCLVPKDYREAKGGLAEEGWIGTLIFSTSEPSHIGLIFGRRGTTLRQLESLTKMKLKFDEST